MLKFIPMGPVEGFYHVCYQVTGTLVFSSVCICNTEEEAIDEAAFLNANGATFRAAEVITSTK
jgi:hypothetical protein